MKKNSYSTKEEESMILKFYQPIQVQFSAKTYSGLIEIANAKLKLRGSFSLIHDSYAAFAVVNIRKG